MCKQTNKHTHAQTHVKKKKIDEAMNAQLVELIGIGGRFGAFRSALFSVLVFNTAFILLLIWIPFYIGISTNFFVTQIMSLTIFQLPNNHGIYGIFQSLIQTFELSLSYMFNQNHAQFITQLIVDYWKWFISTSHKFTIILLCFFGLISVLFVCVCVCVCVCVFCFWGCV